MKTSTYSFAFSEEKIWKKLIFVFLILGIAIRLFHFFYNRSLWMDEVYLSESLIKYDYLDLINKPLYYQQKAPIGFMLSVKLMVNIFGNKEFSLRLIPLLSGVLSLFLFVPVSKYFLSSRATVIALGILCFSPALVYHSVEIKQYATELLFTILCFSLLIRIKQHNDLKSLTIWGIIGALIIWFSYSSIFVLAGIAVGMSLYYILQKNWRLFFLGIIPYSIWLISFLINYLWFTHKHAESEWIIYWFKSYHNFMPFPPKTIEDLKWFAINTYRLLDYPLGLLWNFYKIQSNSTLIIFLKMPILPGVLLTLGLYAFFKEKKGDVLILFFPILFTLIASGLELYPLTERFWVFISPIFIIILAKGFDFTYSKIKLKAIFPLVTALILFAPVAQSIIYIIHPDEFYVHKKSFQREALMYINNKYKKGDVTYIYWNNLPGYRLYEQMYQFRINAKEGRDVRSISKDFKAYFGHLKPDLVNLSKNKRIWLVFNNLYLTDIGDRIDEPSWYYQKNSNATDHLLKKFLNIGTIADKKITKDISVYLIDCNYH